MASELEAFLTLRPTSFDRSRPIRLALWCRLAIGGRDSAPIARKEDAWSATCATSEGMSRHAFDFLTESQMWSQLDRDDDLCEMSDDDLKAELARYRAHILSESVKPSGKLSVAVSAQQNRTADVNAIKRSVVYFDDVMLPDPVFHLTELTRKRVMLFSAEPKTVPRRELLSALRYMREFTPMIRLGRVRFIPSTHALESPEHLPFYNFICQMMRSSALFPNS